MIGRHATLTELNTTLSIDDVDAACRALDAWEAAEAKDTEKAKKR